MTIEREKVLGLADRVNPLLRKAELKRQYAEILRMEGSEADAKAVEEDADGFEISAKLRIEQFFFPERFAVPADVVGAAERKV